MATTMEYINDEISLAVQKLREYEDKIQLIDKKNNNNAQGGATTKVVETTMTDNNDASLTTNKQTTTRKRQPQQQTLTTNYLNELSKNANGLLLMHELKLWSDSASSLYSTSTTEGEETTTTTIEIKILDEVESYEELGRLLLRHEPKDVMIDTYEKLYGEEYLPLHDYLRTKLITTLRRNLNQSGYPTKNGCVDLLRQHEDQRSSESEIGVFHTIADACEGLTRLQAMHVDVVCHVKGKHGQSSLSLQHKMDDVLTEFCRPLVDRVRFHFVVSSPDRPTSTRIDRLPEWLFMFLRENVFNNDGGPWELIYVALTSRLTGTFSLDFINEIVRMVQWVLGERNFFRHASIAGPGSNPQLLCNAIEQLLQFDDLVRNLLVDQPHHMRRLVSLIDVFVAGDDELLSWWMKRERECALSILFDQDIPETLSHRISPRAELFCSLIRSIKAKASVFSFSDPYLAHVAVPVCMQFLDAVHESATDLRRLLVQRRIPTDDNLRANFENWVELINGTHMATMILLDYQVDVGTDQAVAASELTSSSASSSTNQDLIRFGRSLERLREALVQDFSRAFVENILMEKTKFAGYLMQCSHLVATEQVLTDEKDTEPSGGLLETLRALRLFLACCADPEDSEIAADDGDGDEDDDDDDEPIYITSRDMCRFAPQQMRDWVLGLIAEKLLDVALNTDGMTTPDIFRSGSILFARDVETVFSSYTPSHSAAALVPPLHQPSSTTASVLRLLDIVRLMTWNSAPLVGLGDALCGLAGQQAPLSEDAFDHDSDDRVAQEAMSMVQAKGGWQYLRLSDVISVLNRRRDL